MNITERLKMIADDRKVRFLITTKNNQWIVKFGSSRTYSDNLQHALLSMWDMVA